MMISKNSKIFRKSVTWTISYFMDSGNVCNIFPTTYSSWQCVIDCVWSKPQI